MTYLIFFFILNSIKEIVVHNIVFVKNKDTFFLFKWHCLKAYFKSIMNINEIFFLQLFQIIINLYYIIV